MPHETDSKAYSGNGYAYIPLADQQQMISMSNMIREELELAGVLTSDFVPSPIHHISLVYGNGVTRTMLEDAALSFVFREFSVLLKGAIIFENEQQHIVIEVERNELLDSLQRIIFQQLTECGLIPSEFSLPDNYRPHITICSVPLETNIPIERINRLIGGLHVVDVKSVRFSMGDYMPIAENFGIVIKNHLPIPPTPQSAQSALFALDMASTFTGVNLSYLKHYFADYQSGFKMIDDSHWLAWYTNNFEDKEKEIISQKALREFIDKANDGTYEMPELWFHHIEGTRHGQVEKLFLIDHFALAYGTFDDIKSNAFVSAMKSWYDSQNIITLSHGFFYEAKNKKDGVYHKIRTYEISTLPAGREANPFTAFQTRLT